MFWGRLDQKIVDMSRPRLGKGDVARVEIYGA